MLPWFKMAALIFTILPRFIVNPLFWLVVLLIYNQYRRLNRLQEDMFGLEFTSVGKQVWQAVLFGLAGGVVGSFLMTSVGVSLSQAGIMYVWPVAILLMLINPRFMCFAYAAGLISLAHLIFGFPDLEIPQLLGLVAVLHMVESILIYLTGHLDPIPVIIKNPAGQLIGGFNLQKFWPLPVVIMLTVALDVPELTSDLIRMPDWWPLIKPQEMAAAGQELVYSLFLVTAALGYSDLALTCTPRQKAGRTAAYLALYSLLLLAAAIGASYYAPLLPAAALFSPLGHELVVYLGGRRELKGRAIFTPPPRGVMVLAVVPGGLAAKYGLVPGEVILKLGGGEVFFPADLTLDPYHGPPWELITLQPVGRGFKKRYITIWESAGDLGIIPVPRGRGGPYMKIQKQGPLLRLFRRLRGRK